MFKLANKKIVAITAILVAVILLAVGLANLWPAQQVASEVQPPEPTAPIVARHPLTGQGFTDKLEDFFAAAAMIDNAADIAPQAGLHQAVIIYEALAESNITRLLAIFDSQVKVNKIGPIRSARNYFMDWAEEYQGLYLHVGGSPQALAAIKNYNFYNIDEMGSGGVYFTRDQNLSAPHNVFTSTSDLLRAAEMKKVSPLSQEFRSWNFTEQPVGQPENFSVNFSTSLYQIDWQFNSVLNVYQRFRQGEKVIDASGEHLAADNIIVQVVDSRLIDIERRSMETKGGGQVFIFNRAGRQTGQWQYVDGRTIFVSDSGQELTLVPGKTWVEIIDLPEKLIVNQ